MVSATTYTLVGVINKFLTVLLAVFFLDKHASGWGIAAVCFCLLSGTLYQQADKRDTTKKTAESETKGSDAANPLLSTSKSQV